MNSDFRPDPTDRKDLPPVEPETEAMEQPEGSVGIPDEQSADETVEEAVQEPPKKPSISCKQIVSFLFDYVEMFVWAIAAVLVVFTLLFRLCRVDGQSMETTLHENQTLILRSVLYEPKQDDIIVFHMTSPEVNMEKTLVKRVIATGGQTLVIDIREEVTAPDGTTRKGSIRVDGVLYEDSHAVFQSLSPALFYQEMGYDRVEGKLTVTVPEGYLFVMGDNRNNSKDSRNPAVGFVDERSVLGKVILRIAPFTVFD